MKSIRSSGILLHITSLPGSFGIGDLGPSAYQFADFLNRSGVAFWQILPINHIDPAGGHSPYSALSAFAGDPWLISLEKLCSMGLLQKKDILTSVIPSEDSVDFQKMTDVKEPLFEKAFKKFCLKDRYRASFKKFCADQAEWLDSYTMFISIRNQLHGKNWWKWPKNLRDRDPSLIRKVQKNLKNDILKEKFLQYIFFRQWFELKSYCRKKGIRIIGDVPIYVGRDSVDVWAHRHIFSLKKNGIPTAVSGAPPDYYSRTGQRWGNPLYLWSVLRKTRYAWWMKRLNHNLKLFDKIRIDHFRGFVAYWAIPTHHKSARRGKWVKAPARDFLKVVLQKIPKSAIIAEDLGYITADVRQVMDHFGFAGMRLLLFGFGPKFLTHRFAPHNHVRNCVVYTGTHDNNTAIGWLRQEATQADRKRLEQYVAQKVTKDNVASVMRMMAWKSVADLAVVPIQDVLELGPKARMNIPATVKGNWVWKLTDLDFAPVVSKMLYTELKTCKRI